MVQREPNFKIKENSGLMGSPANPVQWLKNMLAELVLEKTVKRKTLRKGQSTSWEVAKTEILLARTAHNSEKEELLSKIDALQSVLAKKSDALAHHEAEKILLLAKINSLLADLTRARAYSDHRTT